MSFRFSPHKSFAENITGLINGRLTNALAMLAGLQRAELSRRDPAYEDPEKSIHSARKDLKRARAVLRLARYGMDPRVFERENTCLRVAGRALSLARDAQVLATVFDQLDVAAHCGESVSPATRTRIRQRLADEAQAAGHDTGLVPALREAAGLLEGVRSRCLLWGLPERGGGWLLDSALKTVYRRGRRAMTAVSDGENPAVGTSDAVLWHTWRKRVKDLAYQTHLLRPFRPKAFKKFAAELDKLAELLGDIHDLDMLREKLGATATVADGSDNAATTTALVDDPMERTALNRLIATRRTKLQRKALKIGCRVYEEKPGAFTRRVRRYWRSWQQEPEADSPGVPDAPLKDESPANA